MKQRAGKVTAPDTDKWTYENVFEAQLLKIFEGTDGSMKLLKSEDGKAKVVEAHKKTAELLGYTLETAKENEEQKHIFQTLQYSKPEKEETGEDSLRCEVCDI